MAAFDDIARGLACAIAIQDGFDERNQREASPALRVRIGLAVGEPVDRGDDLFGATVNLASRICAAAEAGQILVSDDVRASGVDAGYQFRDAGSRVLKGFAEPIALYELLREPAS
jgi:class 3 adenylate cyclase